MINPYKNIIIFGRTRVGKSTLAKKIADILPYQILRADPLRDSFSNCFSELGIGIDTAISNDKYQFFLYDYLCRMTYEAKEKYGYVLEGFEISMDTIKKYFLNDDNLLYCLGTLDISAEEFVQNIRKYDTEYDWTYNMDKKELLKFAKGELQASKRLQEICYQNNIPFYNTSIDREKTLNLIVEDASRRYIKKK